MAAVSEQQVASCSSSIVQTTSKPSAYKPAFVFPSRQRHVYNSGLRACRDPVDGRVVQEAARDVCHPRQDRCRYVQQGVSGLRERRPREEAVRGQAH